MTTIELDGPAEAVSATIVEQRGDEIVVLVPKRIGGFFGRSPDLRLRVTAPRLTSLAIQSGSADVMARGHYGPTRIHTGSGDIDVGTVEDSASLRTSSGTVRVAAVVRDVDVVSGSGDVTLGSVGGALSAKTGSGDIKLDSGGTALRAQTGSGDVSVGDTPDEVSAKTASGDVRLDAITHGDVKVKVASGTIHAGVRTGTAAWLDVRTISGKVRSSLEPDAEPSADEQQVRLQLDTVSGNIELVRV